ncbi:MAG: AraC family transcriptional regulator [Eubacteriales bacterium]|nr:AraC family transcriptional regulator [Eubacteriales bacterium]
MSKQLERYAKESDKLFKDFASIHRTLEELPPLYLDYCGIEECSPGHSFGPYIRDEYVLHIVLDGKGVFRNGKDCFEIGADNMFLIYPGEETFYKADELDPWYYCWIGFHGASAGQLMENIGFTRCNPVLPFAEGNAVLETLHKAMQIETDILTEVFFRRACINKVMALLLNGSAHHRVLGSVPSQEFSYTAYAARYLQRHFAERVRVDKLAEKIGISRSYLVRLFREHFGISPQEYLIQLRMTHASGCLLLTDDSIRSIALESGYQDPLAFSRYFKQRFGVSPRMYREQYRQTVEDRVRSDTSHQDGSSEQVPQIPAAAEEEL